MHSYCRSVTVDGLADTRLARAPPRLVGGKPGSRRRRPSLTGIGVTRAAVLGSVGGPCKTASVADKSSIEWTEATWNPTTGCDRISRGCDNCYALTLAKRLKAMGNAKYQLDGDPRTSGPGFAVQAHDDTLDVPRRWSAPRVVFVNSMSDLFDARVPDVFIRDVFQVMAETPRHTYQVLTKRPIRLARMADQLPWPENIWMGVSVRTWTRHGGWIASAKCRQRSVSCPPNHCSGRWPTSTCRAPTG